MVDEEFDDEELLEGEIALSDFKNIHKNERCFVFGNGPSVNNYDFDSIGKEIIFGCNYLYKGVKKFKINPKYYAISDHEAWRTSHEEVSKLKTHLFLPKALDTKPLTKNHDYTFTRVKQQGFIEEFPKDDVYDSFQNLEKKGLYTGYTVIIDLSIQICFHMGFSKVYLLGVDWNYSQSHHFFALPGDEWPWTFNPKFAEPAMETCKEMYEKGGKQLINCTPNSSLNVLPKENLDIVTFTI